MELFRALGLSENTLSALQKKGWTEPSAIQTQTIPLLLADEKDVVGQAQTGTGKTGAFGLPIIDKLDDTSNKTQALILCPTRELAVQVAEEISSFKGTKRLSVLAVYGGASFSLQQAALRKGVQIVVGTPGRIRDHLERGTLKLDSLSHVVLDEADEMLNMGFEEEVREILKSAPTERRMLLFSATMPPQILKLAKTFMRDYEVITVKTDQLTMETIDQMFFEVRDHDRLETLCRIIDTEPEFYGIVFCRTKVETDQVADKLIDRGYDAEAIHGDVTQSQREQILRKFKLRKLTILVATDVAARGIDVNDLTHVVNFNLPQDPEAYVHRIGRTGRAGKQGTAITIVSPREKRDIIYIERIARAKIRQEDVPTVADVLETKTMKLKTEMQQIIETNKADTYKELATELLAEEGREPVDVLAAFLSYTLKDALNERAYREIGAVNAAQEAKGKARLFVAKGHVHNFNVEKVINFIAQETGIDGNVIHDVRVYDNFSFITLPTEEGELVLIHFNRNKKGGKPLVTRAKERDSGGGGGGFGGGGGYKAGGNFRSSKPFGDKKFGDKPYTEKKFSDKPYSDKKFSDKPFAEKKGVSKPYTPKPPREEFAPREEKTTFSPQEFTTKKKTEKKADAPKQEGSKFIPVKKRENKLVDYLDKPVSVPKKTAKKDTGASPDTGSDLGW